MPKTEQRDERFRAYLAALSTPATLLGTPKRHIRANLNRAVDTDRATVDLGRHTHSSVNILRIDSPAQAKLSVVGSGNHLFFIFEFADHDDWTKDLFLINSGIKRCLDKDCGFDKISLLIVRPC